RHIPLGLLALYLEFLHLRARSFHDRSDDTFQAKPPLRYPEYSFTKPDDYCIAKDLNSMDCIPGTSAFPLIQVSCSCRTRSYSRIRNLSPRGRPFLRHTKSYCT